MPKTFSLKMKLLFSLLPLFVLLLTGECIQRLRYFIHSGNTEYLYYGFIKSKPVWLYDGLPGEQAEGAISAQNLLKVVTPGETVDSLAGRGMVLRGKFYPFLKPAGTLRVVTQGSSSTYGSGYNDQTYPIFLERKLTSFFNPHSIRVEVLNFGVAGQNSTHAYDNLVNYVQIFSPDLVILYMGFNDSQYTNQMIYRNSFEVLPLTFSRFIYYHSLLYVTAFEKFVYIKGQKKENVEKNTARFIGNLHKMVQFCSENSICFLIVPEAANFTGRDRFTPGGRCYADEMKAIRIFATEKRCSYLEVADKILENPSANFQDQVHLYPAGREVLASEISNYLEKSGWIDKAIQVYTAAKDTIESQTKPM